MNTSSENRLSPWLMRLCLFVAGTALAFTFAPFEQFALLSWLILLYFYWQVKSLTPKAGLIAGWFFGLGYFGFGVNWVYNSISMFGGAVVPLAAAITLLFILVMTVFPALCAGLFCRWRDRLDWQWHAILFASLWLLLELARGKIMGGFPWILLGYSQTSTPVGALAPFIGVYGIGFLMLLVLPFCLDAVLLSKQRLRGGLLSVVVLALFGLLIVSAGKVEFTQPKNTEFSVRLVQANIPQELKFSRERLRSSIEQYTALSQQNLGDIDLIVWPETAIPTYFGNVDQVLVPFAEQLRAQGTEVLSGGFHREGGVSFNSIRQLGGEQALYQKRHLVPFGEYMPFRFLLNGLAAFVEIPMSDLGEGSGPNLPMTIHNEQIGLSICYEDVFGEEMRELVPASTVLINVSNDAWFGEKIAPFQHEQKAQMRARELGRPLIRVTNTGVSSVIDYQGLVHESIVQGTAGYVDAVVTPRTGTTLYARTGNWPVFLFALVIVLVAQVLIRRNSARTSWRG